MASTAEWDDQPVQSTSRRPTPIPRAVIPVCDDWEDDDAEDEDEGDPQNAEANQRLWENANAQTPMPRLILSKSSSSHAAAPPAAAFQPKMRILKRPAPSEPVGPALPAAAGETIKEREARYQEARERIFGKDSPAADKKAAVVRNPRGPQSPDPVAGFDDVATPAFKERSGRPPPAGPNAGSLPDPAFGTAAAV